MVASCWVIAMGIFRGRVQDEGRTEGASFDSAFSCRFRFHTCMGWKAEWARGEAQPTLFGFNFDAGL